MAMEKKYLIINIGSTSKKYGLYFDKSLALKIHLEDRNPEYFSTVNGEEKKITKNEYERSIEYLLERAKGLIKDKKEIIAIGIRIVAPGIYFQKNRIIDKKFMSELKTASNIAPLHIKPTLKEINSLKKLFPKVKICGISDSEFHANIPDVSRYYSIPKEIASKFEILRYGYHGISVKAALLEVKKLMGNLPSRIILCHLGGGSSITAVKDGKSLDTSMGFTPLEGIMGSTRSGNIDVLLGLYLIKKLKIKNPEEYFNTKCGLLGLSKTSGDLRDLIKSKNEDSLLAIDIFANQIKKQIGAYHALLNGLDILIFTGGIGVGSVVARLKICKNLDSLGVVIDEKLNQENKHKSICASSSKVKILVIDSDEMGQILEDMLTLL